MVEIPVSETKFKELTEFFEGKRHYVFFRAEDLEKGMLDPSTLFLMIHGAEDGSMDFGSSLVKPDENLLSFLIKRLKLKEKGIKSLIYNCCHGGVNQDISVDGIEMKCIHRDTGTTSMRIDRDVWYEEDSQAFCSIFFKEPNF